MLLASILLAMQIPNSGMEPGTGVQRTMQLLESGQAVKIMFYGQSITASAWPKQVEEDLKKRFPQAKLECRNMAISGFAANLLKRTAERDSLEAYPDLIILHVYGGEPEYEELVRTLRSSSSAELLLQSDHVTGMATGKPEDKERDRGILWHDQHAAWLRKTADKYGCGFVDVRHGWYTELARTGRHFKDYVQKDEVHLNEQGDRLMGELVSQYLQRRPQLEAPHLVNTESAASGTYIFFGNRVDVRLTGAKGPVKVLIDGRSPSSFHSLYLPSRTSNAQGAWFPALLKVSAIEVPLLESYTLKLSKFEEAASQFSFVANGSQTGADGNGLSLSPFTSRSKRVTIVPSDWTTNYGYAVSKKAPEDGFTVTWTYSANFKDQVEGEDWQTVAQGLGDGKHTLKLEGDFKSATVRVFRPFTYADR